MDTQPPPRMSRRIKRFVKNTLRRWRRARVGKRLLPRGMVLVLIVTLLGLFGVFAWSVSYLNSETKARQITYDEVTALMRARRIERATFLDEDAIVVGRF